MVVHVISSPLCMREKRQRMWDNGPSEVDREHIKNIPPPKTKSRPCFQTFPHVPKKCTGSISPRRPRSYCRAREESVNIRFRGTLQISTCANRISPPPLSLLLLQTRPVLVGPSSLPPAILLLNLTADRSFALPTLMAPVSPFSLSFSLLSLSDELTVFLPSSSSSDWLFPSSSFTLGWAPFLPLSPSLPPKISLLAASRLLCCGVATAFVALMPMEGTFRLSLSLSLSLLEDDGGRRSGGRAARASASQPRSRRLLGERRPRDDIIIIIC